MLRQVVTAVIELLVAIPPVRFIMELVDPRWRPLWAALWLAVIPSILFLTVRLTRRRARRASLQEQSASERPGAAAGKSGEHERAVADPEERSRVLKPASTPPPSPAPTPPSAPPPQGGVRVPVPVIVGAVAIGLAAVAVASRLLPNKSGAPSTPAPVSTPTAADTGLDVRWRSGRMERGDCIGTFEVKRGGGTRAQFVAFVMDTSGAIIARDSGAVDSALPGVLVDFRFRRVACDRIYDWQLQVTTPKTRTP